MIRIERVVAACWLAGACGAAPAANRVVTAGELVWRAGPGGISSAEVWGDAARGAHGTLARLPAGLIEPPHTHAHAFRVLVLAGTMTYTFGGRVTPPLTAGSYVVIAAGTPHFAHCLADAGCEVFIEQDGAFDVTAPRPG